MTDKKVNECKGQWWVRGVEKMGTSGVVLGEGFKGRVREGGTSWEKVIIKHGQTGSLHTQSRGEGEGRAQRHNLPTHTHTHTYTHTHTQTHTGIIMHTNVHTDTQICTMLCNNGQIQT